MIAVALALLLVAAPLAAAETQDASGSRDVRELPAHSKRRATPTTPADNDGAGEAGSPAADKATSDDSAGAKTRATHGRFTYIIVAPDADKAADGAAAPQTTARVREQQRQLLIKADGRSYSLSLPCSGQALATWKRRLFVACGDEGLAEFSLKAPSTPELEGVRPFRGRVVGFHSANGRLWAELVSTEAVLISDASTAVPPPMQVTTRLPSAAQRPPKSQDPPQATRQDATQSAEAEQKASAEQVTESPTGRVVEVRKAAVVVNLGSRDGLAQGEHIALFDLEEVALASGKAGARERLRAVGKVTAVSSTSAQVALGINESVQVGTRARETTRALTAERWGPPRAAGIWEVSATLRPFLTLGSVGLGSVSDLSVGYRFEAPVHVQLVAEPVAGAAAEGGSVAAAAANLLASFDSKWFEIGLGAGWANTEITSGSGLSVAQVGRIGAADGLHLRVRNMFLLSDDEFRYGATVGTVHVPISSETTLLARGGGGAAGFGYGELGLEWRVLGNGLRDTLFLTGTIGGGGVSGQTEGPCPAQPPPTGSSGGSSGTCFQDTSYAGPMVGLGVTWRL